MLIVSFGVFFYNTNLYFHSSFRTIEIVNLLLSITNIYFCFSFFCCIDTETGIEAYDCY